MTSDLCTVPSGIQDFSTPRFDSLFSCLTMEFTINLKERALQWPSLELNFERLTSSNNGKLHTPACWAGLEICHSNVKGKTIGGGGREEGDQWHQMIVSHHIYLLIWMRLGYKCLWLSPWETSWRSYGSEFPWNFYSVIPLGNYSLLALVIFSCCIVNYSPHSLVFTPFRQLYPHPLPP